MDADPRPGRSLRAVLARHVLPAGRRHRRDIGRLASGLEHSPAHRCRRGVAPRTAPALVERRGCRGARPRGAVRRPLLRPRYRAARERGERRAMAHLAGGARRHRYGVDPACGGAGARTRRARAGALGSASGMRVGRPRGGRRSVAVEPTWRVAGVVHVSLAARPRGRDPPGATALGARRHGCRYWDRRGLAHLGRGGGRAPRARDARRAAPGARRGCRRRGPARASRSTSHRSVAAPTAQRRRPLRALAGVAACRRRLSGAACRVGARTAGSAACRAAVGAAGGVLGRRDGPAAWVAFGAGAIRRSRTAHRAPGAYSRCALRARGAAGERHRADGWRWSADAAAAARPRGAVPARRSRGRAAVHDLPVPPWPRG